jgi:hypothetical protein
MQVDAIENVITNHSKQDHAGPAAFALATLMRMNCYGCHERDTLGGVGRHRKAYFETVSAVDLGDEGRLPPPLTGVGRKLKPAWMKRVVQGSKGTSVRPHMTIRMPIFPHNDVLKWVDQIGEIDGVNRSSVKEVFGDPSSIAKEGQSLMEIGCIQCHEFGSQAMPGVIGVDLFGVPDRIYPAWFRDFLSNPGAIKKRTRMPTFFPDGKSQVPNVLDGDASQQIAAMWSYLTRHREIGVPTKIAEERAKNYELRPSEHPLILRTFMNEVGTHAIAVGFPEGTHYAFDADGCRLAVAWRESFVDARSTWFERFSPPIDPLGTQSKSLDAGESFYRIDPESSDAIPIEPVFLGYVLDQQRVPTFRYRCEASVLEDRIVPNESGGLMREIRIVSQSSNVKESSETVWFRVPVADADDRQTDEGGTSQTFQDDRGLMIRLKSSGESPALAVQKTLATDDSFWMIPVVRGQTLEVQYQW